MKLYEFAPTRSIRARWALQELGINFEPVMVDLRAGQNTTPDFLGLNRAAKLPVLVDGDFVVAESVAIVLYLAEKYPDKGLLPKDIKQRADFQRWLMFTVTELEQPLWRISRNTAIYSEKDRSSTDIALARREFTQMAAVMEDHMRDHPYMIGDHVTVGDFVLANTLDWGNQFKLLGDCPRLVSYMERMYARPRAAPRITQAFASLQAH
jgi:glutathione S-transferase